MATPHYTVTPHEYYDLTTTAGRLQAANALLRSIASCGREFFCHNGVASHLEIDGRQRVWFHDSYTQRRIYTHYTGHWRGFTGGGTLRDLVIALRKFVTHGEGIPKAAFGPWPAELCGGDLWGYGADMEFVRRDAQKLGITY